MPSDGHQKSATTSAVITAEGQAIVMSSILPKNQQKYIIFYPFLDTRTEIGEKIVGISEELKTPQHPSVIITWYNLSNTCDFLHMWLYAIYLV